MDPAFQPITTGELWAYVCILPSFAIVSALLIQWQRNTSARQSGRANHPTSKGLPRK